MTNPWNATRGAMASLVLMLVFSLPGFGQTVSEEGPPVTCGNRLVAGLTCSGRFCDNLTPICGAQVYDLYDIRWTGYVSEEGRGEVACNISNPVERGDLPRGEPAFIAGFACQGRFCDRVALECVALRDYFPESYGGPRCEWTRWMSEETPTIRFPEGAAAIRMACRGRFCDDKRFYVCPLKAR